MEYFHLERIGDLDQENDNMEEENWQEQVDDPAEDDMEDEQEFVLEPEEKYRMARDSLNELRELLCCHGTQQYLEYLWELEKAKTRARRSLSLLTSKKMQLKLRGEG